MQDVEDEEYNYERNEDNNSTNGLETMNELHDVDDNNEEDDDYDSHNGVKCQYNNCQDSNSEADDIEVEDDLKEEYHQDGLVSKIKSKRIKQLEAQLTQQQLEEERRWVLHVCCVEVMQPNS